MNAAEICQKLIGIPSYVADGMNENNVAEFIQELIEGLGKFTVTRQPVGDRFNIIALPRSKPELLFCCHMDTVPPSDGWSRDPFAGIIEGDRLYGLGACDMKGGTAALLYAIEHADNLEHVAVLFDIDEEYDLLGIKAFLKDYTLDPKLAIFPEPGLVIQNAHRGLIEIDFEIKGETGHASRPHEGKNAISGAGEAVGSLISRLGGYSDPNLGNTSCNLAYIDGGKLKDGLIIRQPNAIPDITRLTLDIRPADDRLRAANIVELFDEIVKARGLSLSGAEIRHDLQALNVDLGDLKDLIEVASSVLGKPVEIDDPRDSGYSEAGIVKMSWGTPSVQFGPGPKAMCHKVDEYVLISELDQCAAVFGSLIKRYSS